MSWLAVFEDVVAHRPKQESTSKRHLLWDSQEVLGNAKKKESQVVVRQTPPFSSNVRDQAVRSLWKPLYMRQATAKGKRVVAGELNHGFLIQLEL